MEIKNQDGAVTIQVPSNSFDEVTDQLKEMQEKLLRIITGHNFVYKNIEADDITELMFEIEDTSAYLEEAVDMNDTINRKIQHTLDVLSLTGKPLTEEQMSAYQFYITEYEKCTETLDMLIDNEEKRQLNDDIKVALFKKDEDLKELYYPLQKISDEQYVAILHLEGMAMLGRDTLDILETKTPLVIEDKKLK